MNWLLFCLSITFGLIVNSQSFSFSQYSLEEGLSQSQIVDIAQLQNGKTYVLSKYGGLDYFNGRTFESVTSTTQATEYYQIQIIKEELFIASQNGILKLQNDTLQLVSEEQQFQAFSNNFIAQANHLYSFSTSQILQHHAQLSSDIRELEEAAGGVILLDKLGVRFYDLNKQSLQSYITKAEISTIARFEDYLLCALNNGKIEIYGLNNNTLLATINVSSPITDIEFIDNRCYISTSRKGLCSFVFEKEHLANIQLECLNTSEFPFSNCLSLSKDSYGLLFVGTNGQGLLYQNPKQIEYFSSNKLHKQTAISCFSKWKSNLLIGSVNGLLTEYNPISESVTKIASFPSSITGIQAISDTSCIISLDGSGLVLLSKKNSEYTSKYIGESTFIKDLELSNSTCYYSDYINGVFQISNLQQNAISFRKILSGKARYLETDLRNRTWYYLEPNQLGFIYDQYPVALNDLLPNIQNPQSQVTCFKIIQNRLWIGFSDQTIWYSDLTKNQVQFHQFSGLSLSKLIYSIETDGKYYYFCSEKGIEQVLINADLSAETIQIFSSENGLKGIETIRNSSIQYENSIWVGTVNGLNRVSNGTFNNQFSPISQAIEVRYGKQSVLLENKKNIQFRIHNSSVFIQVQSEFLLSPNNQKYRIQVNNEWTEWQSDPSFLVSNLQKGNNQIQWQVKAINYKENYPKQASIILIQPFYTEVWFFVLLGIISLISITFFIQYLLSKQKATFQKKIYQVELEQKASRLQMHPHFLFNALNTIKANMQPEQLKEARLGIAKFAKLMRKSLDLSTKSLVEISEELEWVEQYVALENLMRDKPILLSINHSEEIGHISIPPFIIQPFIENCCKHAFPESIQKPLVNIQIIKEPKNIEIVIQDNGIGIKPSKHKEHKSKGLEITSERLRLFNASNFKIDSDLTGTRVTIHLK